MSISENVSTGGSPDQTPLDGRGGGVIAYSVTYPNNTNKIFLMNADGRVRHLVKHVNYRDFTFSKIE